MRHAVISLAFLLAQMVYAQTDQPVTFGELTAVRTRLVELTFSSILEKPNNLRLAAYANPDQPATRDAVVELFGFVADLAKPKFAFSPAKKFKVDTKIMRPLSNPESQEKLVWLIEWGFVVPYGQVASGSSSTFTPNQLGDVLGLFMSKLADYTHVPSEEYSPNIRPEP